MLTRKTGGVSGPLALGYSSEYMNDLMTFEGNMKVASRVLVLMWDLALVCTSFH